MKHIFWTLVAILILALPVVGQISNPSVIPSSPPSTCKAGVPLWSVFSTGTLYICNNGTPTAVSGGGGGNLSGTLTPGYLPLSITDTHTLGNSLADYGVTTAGTYTFPQNMAIGGTAQLPLSGYTVDGPLSIGPQQSIFVEPLSDYIPVNASNVIAGNHTDLSPALALYNQNTLTSVQIATALEAIEQVNGTASSAGIYSVGLSIPGLGNTSNEFTAGVVGSSQIGVYPGGTDVGGAPILASLYAAANSNFSLKTRVPINAGLYVEPQADQGLVNAGVYISDQTTTAGDYAEYIAGGELYSHGPVQFDNITGHGTAGVVAIDASGNLSVGSAGSSGVNIPYGTAGGTANAQTLTTTPPVTSLSVGTTVTFIPSGSPSSGSPTLNVGSTGAKTIVKGGSTYPTALFTGANGDMNTAMYSTVTYDGTYWVLQNPAGLSGLYVGSSSVAIGPTGIPNPGSSAIQIGAGTNSASQDTVVGYAAEGSGAGGGSDSIFGYSSCTGSGGANACFGHNAGRNQGTSGTGNSIFGAEAGYGTGHNNSFTESGYFGYGASPSANSVVNQWLWGYQVTSSLSNYQQFGNSSITETAIAGVTLPVTIYSHAGTQLATCASGLQGGEATVSDATSLTPGTAYSVTAGAGSDTIRVQCTLTGSTYAWQTM